MSTLRLYRKPFDPFNLMEDFFNEAQGARFNSENFAPANVIEKADSYFVNVEVPGYKKDQLNVDYNEGVLKVSGQREEKAVNDEDLYHLQEITKGSFVRSFRIPDVQDTKIEASYDNGILSVLLPKREAAAAKKISINEGKSFFKKIEEKVKSI